MKKLYELIFKKWNEKILRKKKGILQNGLEENEIIEFFKSDPINENYELHVECKTDMEVCFIVKERGTRNNVFATKFRYGKLYNEDAKCILYIDDFYRMSGKSCGVGKKTAVFIRKLAEAKHFDILALHPCAFYEQGKGYLNQEQLEYFYRKYLTSENYELKFMTVSDAIYPIGV